MLISVFLVSLVALCVKMIHYFNVAETLYYRAFVGLAFSTIFVKLNKMQIYIDNRKEMILVIMNSMLFVIG